MAFVLALRKEHPGYVREQQHHHQEGIPPKAISEAGKGKRQTLAPRRTATAVRRACIGRVDSQNAAGRSLFAAKEAFVLAAHVEIEPTCRFFFLISTGISV
jgi:hypothetical protein